MKCRRSHNRNQKEKYKERGTHETNCSYSGWTRDEGQLREREATLTSELQIEQSKLNELNSQLENLVRQLDGP